MSKAELNIEYDEEILDVLENLGCSVIFSTYQAGRVIVVGHGEGKLSQIPFPYKKPMGIAVQGAKLAVATINTLQFLSNKENVVSTVNQNPHNFDTFYLHRATYNTGNLDIHDIDFGDGQLWGVNTAFSCLCVFDVNYNFVPKWKPSFITELVPEDRCHLNGMAMDGSLPKYVTALSSTDAKEGWRKNIMGAGVLLEVPSSRVICDGLAMPHSPRIIDGSLYLLESGAGKLLKIDPHTGEKEVVETFGMFIRGMSHHNGILFIGKSKIREGSDTFDHLETKANSTHAGMIVYDLTNRRRIGELNYLDTVEEIFDVQVMPEHTKPALLGEGNDMAQRVITYSGGVFWRKDISKTQ